MSNITNFLFILLIVGLLWLKSSLGKFTEGKFVDSLAGTLTKFASQNPYPWYKDFLNNVAIPNSQVFALLTMWGELFAALSITFTTLYLLSNKKPKKALLQILTLGLIVGAFLNATFWLAAGWTSPSTDSLNLLMFVIQIIGLITLSKLNKN